MTNDTTNVTKEDNAMNYAMSNVTKEKNVMHNAPSIITKEKQHGQLSIHHSSSCLVVQPPQDFTQSHKSS